jgi:DNA gyrase inhibitor GyrI
MSKHDKEKMVLAVVTPEAWQGFYAVMDSLNEQIAAWAMKHDLPPAVMVGLSRALASTVDHFADLCRCDACRAAEISFVDEVMARVTEAEGKISEAVH